MRYSSPHLDDPQRQSIFHAVKKNATRWEPAPADPTVEEWKNWLTEVSERVSHDADLPEFARNRILGRLDKARLEEPPKGHELAALQYYEKALLKSKYALAEQAGQIGAWYGYSAEEVQDVVARYRKEYLTTPRDKRPEVPERYAKSFRVTSQGVPKDPATIYGHWMAENPENYPAIKSFERYAALDLETTGISTKDSHIIEVGFVIYDANGKEIERYETFVRPPVNEEGQIDTGPVDVHGIKPEDVKDAPTFAEVLPEIQAKLEGTCLVGHNIGFDTRHLRVSIEKAAASEGRRRDPYPWIAAADTYWKAARSPEFEHLPNSKLATVAEEHGIPYTNGHRALHDAEVSGLLFFKMREKFTK